MKVKDILKIKGNVLYTTSPDTPLAEAVQTMAHYDIGSLVVIEYGEVIGLLTFREVLIFFAQQQCLPDVRVRSVMDDHPITCTLSTYASEVERIMLEKHARYIPVVENKVLMGVISFYDMSKAVLESKGFENNLLKAYIRDWPEKID
jgi:CBS domain-containing protein